MMKTFEEKTKRIFSTIKENFDSIGAGEETYYDDLDSNAVDSVSANAEIENINEPAENIVDQTVVPVERPPRFRIYWRAWKDGNNSSGQTESILDTAQLARAESMTKLYDLGFNDIEILAIETIKQEEQQI